jgi:prepilin-type processing-associated H-X9-DG protein
LRSSSGLRPFAIFTGIVGILAVAAFVALSLWFGSFIRSAEFQSLVARETGNAFGSRAEIAPLRWNGASAFVESASLQGTPSTALMRLRASQLRAEVNWRAFFSGAWRVEEITIAQLDGEWQNPARPGPPTVVEPPPARPTGLASILPQRFELGILKVGNARLRYGATEISNCADIGRPDNIAAPLAQWTENGKKTTSASFGYAIMPFKWVANDWCLFPRHSGGKCNAAFYDGHAETLDVAEALQAHPPGDTECLYDYH